MEAKLMYPMIIVYALILSFIILFVWRRKKKFKKGVMIGNAKYIKKSSYYKKILIKYRVYNILIKALCILIIFITAYLTARLYKTNKHEEKMYNRDIMLCMDVSGSVYDLDAEIIDTFIDIVSNLKDERFGISAFDSSPVNILPLTNDYNYAISVLKSLKDAFNSNSSYKYGGFSTGLKYDYSAIRSLFAGAYSGKGGSSLIGDGLAYCASTFKKDDNRTKIVIFTTDNSLAGIALISLDEAAGYCKKNDVKVYPIGTKTITAEHKQGLVDVASTTGGKYYDFNKFSTDQIVSEVESLTKTEIIKSSYVTNQDFPEVIFPYIFILLPFLFVFSWRVRI